MKKMIYLPTLLLLLFSCNKSDELKIAQPEKTVLQIPQITRIDTVKYKVGLPDGFIFIRAWVDSTPVRLFQIQWDNEGNVSHEYSENTTNGIFLFRFDSTFTMKGNLLESRVTVGDISCTWHYEDFKEYAGAEITKHVITIMENPNAPMTVYIRQGRRFGKILNGNPPAVEMSSGEFDLAIKVFNNKLEEIITWYGESITSIKIDDIVYVKAPNMYDHPDIRIKANELGKVLNAR